MRSRLKLWELQDRIGESQSRRVYPDFAQVARYAWLAGDRRLAQIGIKTHRQRGEGTDFKQLSEYRTGDALVFGSESNGLPESLRLENEAAILGIPMPGPVRSLNLSVSVGIAAYEAFRQIHL